MPSELDGIGAEVTVEFWQRGNEIFQPENNSICEGFNALNQRELNIHLPWSNGRVYWDAGTMVGTIELTKQQLLSSMKADGTTGHS